MSADAERNLVWAVVGPTASGKTALALSLAKRLDGEIVGVDSVQIYRHFDIGSGKPTASELEQVPHHLVSVLEPTQEIDASMFAQRARQVIDEIRGRNKVPILVGGTFLWMRAILFGLAQAPPANETVRRAHAEFVEQHGRAALHARLQSLDPHSYARLNPNDTVRVSRALEVVELTGRALSEYHAEHGFRVPLYPHRLLGIHFTPEQLTARIQSRVQRMLKQGWADEVRELQRRGFANTRPMDSVGYRQVAHALRQPTFPQEQDLCEEIVRVTRIFARRQRTWLRNQPVQWMSSDAEHWSELGVGPDADPL